MDKAKLKKLLVGDFNLKRLLKSFIFIYLFLLIYAYFISDSMMFMPFDSSYQDNEEIIKITTVDNLKISAKYLKNDVSDATLIFSHGNSEDLGDITPLIKMFYEKGYSIIAYDYPGYGTSEGEPSEEGTYQAVDAVYEYLTEDEKINKKSLVAIGFSLGNGPTTYLAEKYELGAVILQAPFVTAFRVVTHIPILPIDKYRNISRIKNITEPVLIIHGEADDTIPIWHGEKLYKVANNPKESLWIKDAGHFDITDKNPNLYWNKINSFLSEYVR